MARSYLSLRHLLCAPVSKHLAIAATLGSLDLPKQHGGLLPVRAQPGLRPQEEKKESKAKKDDHHDDDDDHKEKKKEEKKEEKKEKKEEKKVACGTGLLGACSLGVLAVGCDRCLAM